MEDIGFCPACGRKVESGTPYCPACGNRLNDPVSERREAQAERKTDSDRITVAAILILVYSVPQVLLGAILFANAGSLAHMIYTDPDLASLLADLISAGFGEAWMASVFEIAAVLMIISGSMGVVAAVLAFTRKFWVLTVVLCILSALMGFATLFGLIIGIIAFLMLYKARSAFDS